MDLMVQSGNLSLKLQKQKLFKNSRLCLLYYLYYICTEREISSSTNLLLFPLKYSSTQCVFWLLFFFACFDLFYIASGTANIMTLVLLRFGNFKRVTLRLFLLSTLPFLPEGINPKWTIKLNEVRKGENKENILNEKTIFKIYFSILLLLLNIFHQA